MQAPREMGLVSRETIEKMTRRAGLMGPAVLSALCLAQLSSPKHAADMLKACCEAGPA